MLKVDNVQHKLARQQILSHIHINHTLNTQNHRTESNMKLSLY